jgi:co-chaperonin GroES (HSP10)
MIRAMNNTIFCRPRPDIHKRICEFVTNGETIDSAVFGKVKIDSTIQYATSAPANNFAFGEVLSVGKGAAWMRDCYRLDQQLAPGDIIGFDLCQHSEIRHEGEIVYILSVDAALCHFEVHKPLPTPLGQYMLTCEEESSGERFTLSKQAPEVARIILPRDMSRGELKVSNVPTSRVKMSVERVIAVGKGGIGLGESKCYTRESVGGVAVEIKDRSAVVITPDPEAVGQLALFMTAMSTDLWAYGKRHRFTSWDRVRGLYDTADDAAAAAREEASEAAA